MENFRNRIYWKNAKGELSEDPKDFGDRELWEEFLFYLNKVEVSDNDREFHPNRISSVRVMDGSIMGAILNEMEKRITDG